MSAPANSKAVIVALVLGIGVACGSPGRVNPVKTTTIDTCGFPGHFANDIELEVQFHSFDALPDQIRSRLHDYLETRLGKKFAARLRFKEAAFMDPQAVPNVAQSYREMGRQYEAYVVLFSLPLEESREYCAGVHLTVDGEIVMGIGLPNIATSPSKSHIVPASRAMAVATQHGMTLLSPSVKLAYDPNRDALVWELSQPSSESGHRLMTVCNVDAHTGNFISWTQNVVLAS